MNPKPAHDDDPGARRRAQPAWPAVVLASLALALALAATTAQARADEDSNLEPANNTFCSSTATLLNTACGFATKDDFFVAKAKCINIGDARLRHQCLTEARQARTDADSTCAAQLDARRAACAKLGEARYDPVFTPDRFDSDFRRLTSPNPYFPLGIGYHWDFLGSGERGTMDILDAYKLVEGVTCIVSRDLVYKNDLLAEATDDWFAAGRDGSVWYCGEEVKDYEAFTGDKPVQPELVSNAGSFKHGRERDKAGVIMLAAPKAGQAYLEEFSLGNAEDLSEVLSAGYSYGVNAELDRGVPRELALRLCSNRDCLVTKNTALIEPAIVAIKYYARGIGFFLEIKPNTGEVLQLVGCNFDTRCVGLPTP